MGGSSGSGGAGTRDRETFLYSLSNQPGLWKSNVLDAVLAEGTREAVLLERRPLQLGELVGFHLGMQSPPFSFTHYVTINCPTTT